MSTVLITGASGGIGSSMALAFARKGHAVILGYCGNDKKAEEIRLGIEKSGGRAVGVQADITKEEEVETLFAAGERAFGAVDILINNAGVSYMGLLTDMTAEEWDRIFAVNVRGAFLCCKRALPGMIRRKTGGIINVSSVWGETGASCEAAYSASKAALIGLTKALAKEVGPSDIRINCLSPGWIETGMNRGLTEEDKKAFCTEMPLERTGTPEEIAHAALFLAENRYITGQILSINGGSYI